VRYQTFTAGIIFVTLKFETDKVTRHIEYIDRSTRSSFE